MATISQYVRRLARLDELIVEERTGTLQDIGQQLGVKKRQAAVYLKALSDLGKETTYKGRKKSYVYKENSEWNVKWPK